MWTCLLPEFLARWMTLLQCSLYMIASSSDLPVIVIPEEAVRTVHDGEDDWMAF